MYLIAVLCPPLAILMTGRIFQAMLSLFVLPIYFPAALWAILVVADHKADKRAAKYRPAVTVTQNVTVINQVGQQAVRSAPELPKIDEEQAEFDRRRKLEQREAAAAAMKSLPGQSLALAKLSVERGVLAYQSLPEWAQPVTWGLAAASPLAMFAMLHFLFFR